MVGNSAYILLLRLVVDNKIQERKPFYYNRNKTLNYDVLQQISSTLLVSNTAVPIINSASNP